MSGPPSVKLPLCLQFIRYLPEWELKSHEAHEFYKKQEQETRARLANVRRKVKR
jgi:hypothetical protein